MALLATARASFPFRAGGGGSGLGLDRQTICDRWEEEGIVVERGSWLLVYVEAVINVIFLFKVELNTHPGSRARRL